MICIDPEKEIKDEREELIKRLTELNNSFKVEIGIDCLVVGEEECSCWFC